MLGRWRGRSQGVQNIFILFFFQRQINEYLDSLLVTEKNDQDYQGSKGADAEDKSVDDHDEVVDDTDAKFFFKEDFGNLEESPLRFYL